MTEIVLPIPQSPQSNSCLTEISSEEDSCDFPTVDTINDDIACRLISQKEKQAISEIRKRMGSDLTSRYTDVRICRFLRARELNLDKAEEMLRKEIKWRSVVNPEKIFEEFPSHPQFKSLMAYWPGEFHGTDKSGVPLYCERIGAVDPCSLFKNVKREDLIQFHIYMMEHNDRVLESSFERIGSPVGYIYVMDVGELGFKHRNSHALDTIKEISNIDDNYYPETLRKFVVCNTPLLFTFFWKLAKLILDKKTIAKFSIMKSGYLKEIEKSVDSTFIPKYLGGACTSCPKECKKGGGDYSKQ